MRTLFAVRIAKDSRRADEPTNHGAPNFLESRLVFNCIHFIVFHACQLVSEKEKQTNSERIYLWRFAFLRDFILFSKLRIKLKFATKFAKQREMIMWCLPFDGRASALSQCAST